jgi:hypothetical protein
MICDKFTNSHDIVQLFNLRDDVNKLVYAAVYDQCQILSPTSGIHKNL